MVGPRHQVALGVRAEAAENAVAALAVQPIDVLCDLRPADAVAPPGVAAPYDEGTVSEEVAPLAVIEMRDEQLARCRDVRLAHLLWALGVGYALRSGWRLRFLHCSLLCVPAVDVAPQCDGVVEGGVGRGRCVGAVQLK